MTQDLTGTIFLQTAKLTHIMRNEAREKKEKQKNQTENNEKKKGREEHR